MSPTAKDVLKVAGILSLLGVALIVAAGAAVLSAGVVTVTVQDKKPGGVSLHLPVPVPLLDASLRLLPESERREIGSTIAPYRDAMDAFLQELGRCPDGPLVEVRAAGATIMIAKLGRNMVVDVDAEEATIHLSLPLRSLPRLLERLCPGDGRGRQEAGTASVAYHLTGPHHEMRCDAIRGTGRLWKYPLLGSGFCSPC
jgi:hypothetical protein